MIFGDLEAIDEIRIGVYGDSFRSDAGGIVEDGVTGLLSEIEYWAQSDYQSENTFAHVNGWFCG